MATEPSSVSDEALDVVAGPVFREAMSRLSAAVNVVTSTGPAGRLGFTASAVCSVSDSPPTLLVCMNRASRQNVPLQRNGVFCVNSLAADHRDIAQVFAGYGGVEMPDRFRRAAWTTLASGSPVLRDAVAAFDCRLVSVAEIATHSVLVGEVLACHTTDAAEGLVYFGREFHGVGAAPIQPVG
jgi:flavin reductase